MPDVPWFLYAIPLAMLGLLAFAALYKYMQVREAARWPSVQGKVVVSRSELRDVEIFDDNNAGGKGTDQRNFAKVVYEYTVRGKSLRHSRVSIGEDLGNFEVAETIARYPVGKSVTVYYNPRKPNEAVLERDAPKGIFGCVAAIVVVGIIGVFFTFFGFNQLTQYLRSLLPYPERAPMVVALAAMGLVALWIGLAIRKHAAKAATWPKVAARIERSDVEEFRGRIKKSDNLQTLYRARIVYSYEYNGIKYGGDEVSLNGRITSNSSAPAKKQVAKYPAGKILSVYVNPDNPSEAVLDPSTKVIWFIGGIVLVLWGLAYFVSQQS